MPVPYLETRASRGGAVAWLPAGLLSLCMAGATLGAWWPAPGGPAALVYPPWWPVARAVQAAASAGSLVRVAWPGIVVIRPEPGSGGGGAWFSFDPVSAGLCGDGR